MGWSSYDDNATQQFQRIRGFAFMRYINPRLIDINIPVCCYQTTGTTCLP